MVGGCAGILASGELQHGFDGVFEEVQRRSARDAGWDGDVWNLCAWDEPHKSGARDGMERRGGSDSVDVLDSDGGSESRGSELGGDEKLSRCDSRAESGLFVEEGLWDSVCGLVVARRRDAGGFDCDGVLGVRRDVDEADGSGDGADGGSGGVWGDV